MFSACYVLVPPELYKQARILSVAEPLRRYDIMNNAVISFHPWEVMLAVKGSNTRPTQSTASSTIIINVLIQTDMPRGGTSVNYLQGLLNFTGLWRDKPLGMYKTTRLSIYETLFLPL